MKRYFQLFAVALVATLSLSLVSCNDENESVAYTLEGTWEGDMHISAQWSGIPYAYMGSRISFQKDPRRYAKGKGYWVDYYDNYYQDYAADRFDWEVRGGRIYIHFWYHPADLEIYDYYVDGEYFYGKVYDGYISSSFRLYNIDWDRWNDYQYDDYWWSNSTTFDNEATDTTKAPLKPADEK